MKMKVTSPTWVQLHRGVVRPVARGVMGILVIILASICLALIFGRGTLESGTLVYSTSTVVFILGTTLWAKCKSSS